MGFAPNVQPALLVISVSSLTNGLIGGCGAAVSEQAPRTTRTLRAMVLFACVVMLDAQRTALIAAPNGPPWRLVDAVIYGEEKVGINGAA